MGGGQGKEEWELHLWAMLDTIGAARVWTAAEERKPLRAKGRKQRPRRSTEANQKGSVRSR